MLKKYLIPILLVTIFITNILTGVFSYSAGKNYIIAKTSKEVIEAVEVARKEEKIKQEKVNEISQKTYTDLEAINTKLNVNLSELYERSDKRYVPKDTKDKCEGSTGAELSRADARFLTREAARADSLRAALKGCYSYADEVSSLRTPSK